MPKKNARAAICHNSMTSNSTASQYTIAWSIANVCVIINTRRRSKRSAMAPPTAPTNSRGSVSKKATTPIASGDRETCQTNQLWATFCMKSPELDTNEPSIKRRKLRCRSERRGLNVQRSFKEELPGVSIHQVLGSSLVSRHTSTKEPVMDSAGMLCGIADGKSQMPNLKSEI